MRTPFVFGSLLLLTTAFAQEGVGGFIYASAKPSNYRGRCPVMAHFHVIVTSLAHARVRYHWERNGGKTTPDESGRILGGRLSVHDDFRVGKPGESFDATDRLHFAINGETNESVTAELKSSGTCTE